MNTLNDTKEMDFPMCEIVIGNQFIPETEVINNRLSFSLHSADIYKCWNRSGITADYIATFFSYSLPRGARKSSEFFLATSMVSQELLTNALRYSKTRAGEIQIVAKEFNEGLEVEIINPVSAEQFLLFKEQVEKIQNVKEFQEEYFRRIKARSEFPNKKGEGLGLLSILQKFPIKLAFRFSALPDDTFIAKAKGFIPFHY